MNSELKDKHVLITGASGGIGQATALSFAAEGARLALHYHTNRQAVEETIEKLNVPCASVQADLRDESQADAMFAESLAAFPRVDVVVVNAGIWRAEPVPLQCMTVGQWRATLDADLTSVFLTCRAFLRHLAEVSHETASIVLVASTAALFGEADHAPTTLPQRPDWPMA